jgi:hypothetical protein
MGKIKIEKQGKNKKAGEKILNLTPPLPSPLKITSKKHEAFLRHQTRLLRCFNFKRYKLL